MSNPEDLWLHYQYRLKRLANEGIAPKDIHPLDEPIYVMFKDRLGLVNVSPSKSSSQYDLSTWARRLPQGYGVYRCPGNGSWQAILRGKGESWESAPIYNTDLDLESAHQFGLGYFISRDIAYISRETTHTRRYFPTIIEELWDSHEKWVVRQLSSK